MFNKSSPGGFNATATVDKMYLSWRVNNVMNLMDMTNALGDLRAFTRLVRQTHYLIRTIWDEEYSANYKKLQEQLPIFNQFLVNQGMSPLSDEEVGYEGALYLLGQIMECLGRNNMLPQKDIETTIGEDPFFIQAGTSAAMLGIPEPENRSSLINSGMSIKDLPPPPGQGGPL